LADFVVRRRRAARLRRRLGAERPDLAGIVPAALAVVALANSRARAVSR
jgi:hypothetical protein